MIDRVVFWAMLACILAAVGVNVFVWVLTLREVWGAL
jgi:hypothetical protein